MDSDSDTGRRDPTEADEYGINDVFEGVKSLKQGDHLRLDVTWMTEASGEEQGTFDAEVESVDDETIRVELDVSEKRAWRPPRSGDWYISGGTAFREGSQVAYSIDRLRVWRGKPVEAQNRDDEQMALDSIGD